MPEVCRADAGRADAGPVARVAFPAAVFLLAIAVLLVGQWSFIQRSTFEIGDFASNSVLVQSAKQLGLWHGNYSRIGFYHPGPAILYCLAAGEVVFHDLLNWTSPIGGQLVAVLIYNASWLCAIFFVLRRWLGDRISACLVLLLFAGGTALVLPSAFTGLWFPHLYYFPFATFLLALAPAIEGSRRAALVSAVSAGVLMNGHASFIAIVAIMYAVALAGHFLLSLARPLRMRRWFSKGSRRGDIATAAACAVVLSFFMLPFVLRSIFSEPSPLAEYLTYSRQNAGNTVQQTVRFTVQFFGGRWGALAFAAAAAIVAALSLRHAPALRRPVLSFAVGAVAAVLAVLFYAQKGVDDLGQAYVAFFFYAVPVSTATMAVFWLTGMLGSAGRLARGLAAVLTFLAIVQAARAPTSYEAFFRNQDVPVLYEALRQASPPMVLDLTGEGDWNLVWSTVTGLQAYGARRGEALFCVGTNWHVLFGYPARCTAEQLATRPHFLVAAAASSIWQGQDRVAEVGGVLVGRRVPPRLAPGRTYSPAEMPTFRLMLLDGWSAPEAEFIWSVERTANVRFAVDGTASAIELTIGSFVTPSHGQQVEIRLDGVPVATERFAFGDLHRTVRLPLPGPRERYELTFHMPDAASPSELGLSGDRRRLGVSLYALTVR